MQKCLSVVPVVGLCGGLFCSADLLYSEIKLTSTKNDICKQNESAYVDFVNYEVNKITEQYLDNSISFDDYVSYVDDLSDNDKKKDIIIKNFATDEQAKQLSNYEKRIGIDMVGTTASFCSLFAYEHFDLLKRYNNNEKEL